MTRSDEHGVRFPHESEHERSVQHWLTRLLTSSLIPAEELVNNLAPYLRRNPHRPAIP